MTSRVFQQREDSGTRERSGAWARCGRLWQAGGKERVGGNGVTWTPQPIALGGAPTGFPGAPGCDVFSEVRLSPAGPSTLSKRVCGL
ncbi:unnamed protein product [Rangifer tarandus platyrhynchus]|uniref:Uncharacterized protein n=1 Tax=Rangifer tarandus platyrhynchus TaxID=3082113 RepID=A0AC60A056_RANTA